MNATYRNPILAGCYPDPSICRVGDDYYMVNSSFEYFPGLPIFHSRDLVHWRQIGHALDRAEHLDLDGVPAWSGLWAPTIRFHNGLFYIINTLMEGDPKAWVRVRGNFILRAEHPAGPWSAPQWIPDAPGIDPSLLFDDDGRVWYTGNREVPHSFPGHCEIWLQELDLTTFTLIGERSAIWDGALKQAKYCEGPHLYKINGWYYLLASEGGTGLDHAVTVARSRSVTGPYFGHPKNPILTNRACGVQHQIGCTGHADFVETPGGEWWMVLLGVRPYGPDLCNLGRETFMVPVAWELEWPVASPGSGRVDVEYPAPALPPCPIPLVPARDDFDRSVLGFDWNFVRTPRGEFWSLTERPGHLRLHAKPEPLSVVGNPAFIGRRQRHMEFTARTRMDFTPASDLDVAGMGLIYSPDFNAQFVVTGRDSLRIRLVCRQAGEDRVLADREVAGDGAFILEVRAHGERFDFLAGPNEAALQPVAEDVDARLFCPSIHGPIAGVYVGMFAQGPSRDVVADFDWFEYRPGRE